MADDISALIVAVESKAKTITIVTKPHGLAITP
jgi:hypothetical protein